MEIPETGDSASSATVAKVREAQTSFATVWSTVTLHAKLGCVGVAIRDLSWPKICTIDRVE